MNLGASLAWLLMVDGYLRPGECLDLKVSQVLPRTSKQFMRSVVLRLHPDERGIASKTGELEESLAIRRPWLAELIETWWRSRRSEDLWNFSLAELRKAFLSACRFYDLMQWRPVLYMGRHSGASLDRLTDALPLAEVQRRGRWRTEQSVRRYEKRSLIQEVYLKMRPDRRQAAERCADQLLPLLRRMAGAQCGSKRRKPS